MRYMEKLESVLSDLAEKHGWDWGLKFETGHEYAGSLELRITQKPNDHGNMDVSEVYYLAGLADIDKGAQKLWEKFRTMK